MSGVLKSAILCALQSRRGSRLAPGISSDGQWSNHRSRVQLRVELYNLLNRAIYDERQYENNPTNARFGTIDRSVVRQSNFPRYMQLGLKLLF